MTFETIYSGCGPAVRSALLRFGVQEKDVSDASQDVFLIVWRKLPGFEGRSSVETWVHGICRRVAADYRRSACHRREQLSDNPMPLETASDELLDAAVQRAQTQVIVERSLNQMQPDRRDVLVAFDVHDTKMHEIARLLECPLQTAYARLYSARRVMRGLLGQTEGAL